MWHNKGLKPDMTIIKGHQIGFVEVKASKDTCDPRFYIEDLSAIMTLCKDSIDHHKSHQMNINKAQIFGMKNKNEPPNGVKHCTIQYCQYNIWNPLECSSKNM